MLLRTGRRAGGLVSSRALHAVMLRYALALAGLGVCAAAW